MFGSTATRRLPLRRYADREGITNASDVERPMTESASPPWFFGGPLSPLGWHLGFIEAPFEAVLDWSAGWKASDGQRLSVERKTEPIGKLLARLDPLQTPPKRDLVLATSSGWTAHTSNSHLGGDSVSWVGVAVRHFGVRGVLAAHIPKGQYPYPATQFELLAPTGEPPLMYVRSVSAVNDGGRWAWHLHGTKQAFEETKAYEATRVADRFDRPMLIRYLAALGIEPDRPGYFGEGAVIETMANWRSRTTPVGEERRRLGLPSTH
jgi:hypothetical protein